MKTCGMINKHELSFMKDGKQQQHPVDETIEFVTFSEIVN